MFMRHLPLFVFLSLFMVCPGLAAEVLYSFTAISPPDNELCFAVRLDLTQAHCSRSIVQTTILLKHTRTQTQCDQMRFKQSTPPSLLNHLNKHPPPRLPCGVKIASLRSFFARRESCIICFQGSRRLDKLTPQGGEAHFSSAPCLALESSLREE